MSRGGSERVLRQAHRWFGMGALGFLLLSVGTGLLWADAKFLYWDEHYKEKLRPLAGPLVESATVSLDRVFSLAKAAVGGRALIEHVMLRADFGRLFYEVKLRVEGVPTTLLLDAVSGERLSPITEDLAPIIAAQYVRAPAAVTGVEQERYTPRKKNEPTMPCVSDSMMPGPRKSCSIVRPARFSKTKGGGGKCISRSCNYIS